MCTAVSVTSGDNFFGRNLDLEHTYGEKVVITPRNFTLNFRNGKVFKHHYAIIGMAVICENYPLYFDAANEKGLCIAGLSFPENAHYLKPVKEKQNVASFEFIPWILSQCKNIKETKELLYEMNITDEAFSKSFSPTPLHWIISDRSCSLTVEQTKDGLNIFENPLGVLTNNPTFDVHLANLANYISLSPYDPKNNFSDKTDLKIYSKGMGSIGLPGDYSSMSRFVRACFVASNSEFGKTENQRVSQFFHVLSSVYHHKGCIRTKEGFEITNYSACINTNKGIYYYTTYYNSTITGVDMHLEDLDGLTLISYDLKQQNEFIIQNRSNHI